MAEVLANGLRFHVQRLQPHTQGPVVVFVHGLVIDNLSSFYYTLANPMVQAGAEAVLYDLRGHGFSERPPSGYSPEDACADLIGILDSLGKHDPVHLVANSFGGIVAIRTALEHPERVASLVLIEALFGGDWIEPAVNSLTVASLGLNFDRATRRLVSVGQRKLARLSSSSDELLNHTSLIEDLAGMDPKAADLGSVQCPILAVYGEHSDLVEGIQEIAEGMPNCELRIKHRQAHTLLQDGTEELLEELTTWLGLTA